MSSIRQEYSRLKRQAATYSKRYGVEDTTPSVKNPTRATLERVRVEYERMKGQRWAEATLEQYRKKAGITEEEWKRDPYQKPEAPELWKETGEEPEEAPAGEPETDRNEFLDFDIYYDNVNRLIGKINDVLTEIVGYYGERARRWPIEQNLELLLNELENIRDNEIEEAVERINDNIDIINHLVEQAVGYKKSEHRGAGYYVSFIGQIEEILHDTSWVEVDAGKMY